MQRREGKNRGLEEEARRLREGAHRYRRRECCARRDPQREVAIVAEKLREKQASD